MSLNKDMKQSHLGQYTSDIVYKKQSNDWKSEWRDMPEYDNDIIEPEIIVTFKFKNKKDFDIFHEIIKTELYQGNVVFDGMQRKNRKSAWFPAQEKSSNYLYE